MVKPRKIDYKPNTPPQVMRDFIRSSVIFTDYLEELDVRINNMTLELIASNDEKFSTRTKGAIQFAETVKTIFHDILNMRKADINEEAQLRREEEENDS
jgi:hypothetical protein